MITLTDFDGNPFDYCYTRDEVITMLEKLQLEIEETFKKEELIDRRWAYGLRYSKKIIQQKIDKLREDEL